MIIDKYDMYLDNEVIIKNLDRITNQIFKLLPSREEGGDWQVPLQNLILEIIGMKNLLSNDTKFFSLLCKLEALLTLTNEDDFLDFRKLIFESLRLLNDIKVSLE